MHSWCCIFSWRRCVKVEYVTYFICRKIGHSWGCIFSSGRCVKVEYFTHFICRKLCRSWCSVISPRRRVKVEYVTPFVADFSVQLFMYPYILLGLLYLCLYLRESWRIIHMRVCVCVNNGIVASFIVFGYMHECWLISIVVTCMSYWLGRVYFIFKDEREMLMYYCEILVVYAKNHQVAIHAYVWLSSQVSFLKMTFCWLMFSRRWFFDILLADELYTKMQEYMAMLHDVTIVALKE